MELERCEREMDWILVIGISVGMDSVNENVGRWTLENLEDDMDVGEKSTLRGLEAYCHGLGNGLVTFGQLARLAILLTSGSLNV